MNFPPSPRPPITPSPHHPITPSPHHPIPPSPRQTPRISFLQKWDAPYFCGSSVPAKFL
ncbi:hypothetical protein CWATWH0401_508 [Crocosphaera watsonii WH 0401]|uniref:Uncharacterized protein n=1 Tax=Crocosphaera watsonii WH 0401 TaxID=555881 RepID=T2JFH3_CROWT|nr:hypothetical protein CWATWH0401_508 [Crocosphaera watsonii WH 0401]